MLGITFMPRVLNNHTLDGLKSIIPLTLPNFAQLLVDEEVMITSCGTTVPLLAKLIHNLFGIHYILFSEIFTSFDKNQLPVPLIL
jgi:hypothetical protein